MTVSYMTESPTLRRVLSRSDILSTASSVIASYPSITSACLFGSYAKGTAHPDSDVDIAIFHPDLSWDKIGREIGGVHMDLEGALNKQVDLSVCPPDAFVEKINKYWVPITVGTLKSSSLPSSSTDHIRRGLYQPCRLTRRKASRQP
jgi:predicted nucleotidyltransferase